MRECAWQTWSAVEAPLTSLSARTRKPKGRVGPVFRNSGDMWVPHRPSQGRMAFRKDVNRREKWIAKPGEVAGLLFAQTDLNCSETVRNPKFSGRAGVIRLSFRPRAWACKRGQGVSGVALSQF